MLRLTVSSSFLISRRDWRRGAFCCRSCLRAALVCCSRRNSAHPRIPISISAMDSSKSSSADTEHNPAAVDPPLEDVLVQYIVVRKDLIDVMKWPLGSVIAQGCHAAVAAVWIHREDPQTVEYCNPRSIDSMHKVTLEVKGETQLLNLSKKLEEAAVGHKLWIEQPENMPTCLATKPCWKSQVALHFKKLKLCK